MSTWDSVDAATETHGLPKDEEEVKDDRRFVGLANQGATCYMNSLLQTLFMTPEFRRNLYMWRYNPQIHGHSEDCIPFQLQLLFCKLQLSQSWFAETTGLTKSFQWDVQESFQQHDVQEFCRVLFDAIEESVKNTQQEDMINELFQGVLLDYVKCDNCGYESQREDKYLDVSLAVRNEFDHIYNDSVEKALDNFVSVEHLTGGNLYFCERCQAKQEAHKGLKFKTFPPILMMQLKRFDLDYTTFQRIKINDKVTFPQILNLNPYINLVKTVQPVPEQLAEDAGKKEQAILEAVTEEVRPKDLDRLKLEYSANTRNESIDHDLDAFTLPMDYLAKKIHMDQKAVESRLKRQADIERFRQEGENVYELFSILIHSGSALGGHYYSYIKSFAHDRWFSFNDSTVYEIDEKDMEKAFGGVEKKLWGSYYSSACAYLLVYRKISPQNVNVIDDSEVPDYIMDSIDEEKQKEEVERKEKEERKRLYSIRVYFQGQDKLLEVDKEQTLEELKLLAFSKFELEGISPEDARLRGYSAYQDMYQETYTTQEHLTIEQLHLYNYKVMVLETKSPGDVFEDYMIGGISLKVSVWAAGIEEVENMTLAQKTTNAKRVQMNREGSLLTLLEKIEKASEIPVAKQRVMKKSYTSGPGHIDVISKLEDYHKTMSALRIYDGMALYVEDAEVHPTSKWEEEFDRDLYRYVIKFNHPDDTLNYWAQCDYSAVIDSREPVSKLKELIGKLVSLDIDKFVVKRGGKQGAEIKELDLKINQSSLFNGGIVYVERGTPSRPNEYRICVSYARVPKTAAADWVLFEFTEIVETPINGNLTCAEAKTQICAKANNMYPSMKLDPEKVRLRERTNDRLTRILRESDEVKNYTLFDKKALCIQELVEPAPEVSPMDISLILRHWSPATWGLSSPQELIVPRNTTFHELGEHCAELYHIPLDRVCVSKISYSWNFSRADLPSEQWYALQDSYNRLSSNPWYLSFDGTLIV